MSRESNREPINGGSWSPIAKPCSMEPGVIPGSMATESRIVRGLGNEAALRSSSHGAGRRLGRKEAAKRIGTREFLKAMEGITFDRRHAISLKDEAPQAYRYLDEVMRPSAIWSEQSLVSYLS